MLHLFKGPLEAAIEELRAEAKRRKETTPSDVSIEAWEFAAQRFERALDEAERATETLTPAQYGELHGGVTPQTVTRWIRAGELVAEDTPTGYKIQRDAVRVVPMTPAKLGRTG